VTIQQDESNGVCLRPVEVSDLDVLFVLAE
jgi:hypothetical protein